MDNTLTQGAILLASIYAGILMGIFYDVCYMFRHLHRSKVFDAIMDTVFWAGAFIIAAYTLLQANGLKVRLFALSGFALGFFAYRFTLGYIVVKIFHFIQKGTKSAVNKITKSVK